MKISLLFILISFLSFGQIADINGNTYKTNDGTCIRDFVHVNDLANAHLLSLNFLDINKGFHVFNLGSEKGFSVMEVINECQKLMKTKSKGLLSIASAMLIGASLSTSVVLAKEEGSKAPFAEPPFRGC